MSKLLMVGLPSAGKSTFLAALWHVIDSGEVPESLQQGRLSENREYIESLRRRWQQFEPMQRTYSTTRETIQIQVQNRETGSTADLYFPDLAGEIFDEHWRDRRWMPSYTEQVNGAVGMLLFVHAGAKYKPDFLYDYPLLAEGGESPEDGFKPAVFDMDKACLQAKLVDILQFHRDYLAEDSPIRVAVLVSAWDTVEKTALIEGENVTPRHFIARHIPLLDQFLCSNQETIESRIWGVSALGGAIENFDEKMIQANIEVPSQRIRVVAADGNPNGALSHDITAPVRWAAAL